MFGAEQTRVYRGPGHKAIEERPVSEILEPGDAIVKITRTTGERPCPSAVGAIAHRRPMLAGSSLKP